MCVFVYMTVVKLRSCELVAQTATWRTAPYQLSAIAY